MTQCVVELMKEQWWLTDEKEKKNSCTNNTQLLQIRQQLLRLMDIIWIPDHIFSKIYWSTRIFTVSSVQIASKFINLIIVNSSLYDLCLTKQLIRHLIANKNNKWNYTSTNLSIQPYSLFSSNVCHCHHIFFTYTSSSNII